MVLNSSIFPRQYEYLCEQSRPASKFAEIFASSVTINQSFHPLKFPKCSGTSSVTYHKQ